MILTIILTMKFVHDFDHHFHNEIDHHFHNEIDHHFDHEFDHHLTMNEFKTPQGVLSTWSGWSCNQ
jgi:hypothetical protein